MTSGVSKLTRRKVKQLLKPATAALQRPAKNERAFQGLAVPVVRASTVVFPDAAAFDARYAEFYDGFTYGLYGTPTSRTLEEQLSRMSGAARTLLVPSGQAALTLILAAFLKPGDHALLPDSVYGPVRTFASSWLKDWGVDIAFYDPLIAGDIGSLMTPATRLVLVESPGSNTMEIQDIPAIAAAARVAGALTVADTTWATPLHLDAFAKGVDITVDALSKYASGHGDVLMGAISTNDEAHYRRLKDMTRLFGLGVSADDCSLVLRGLQTMSLRVERSSASGLTIAKHLASRSEIETVLHPALPSDPGYALWKRDFTGASGIFSFLLADDFRGRENDLIDRLQLFAIGASWGSARSVVAPQDPTAGRTATRWTRGKLIRLSIGLEDAGDLLADLDQALDHIRSTADEHHAVAKPAA
jgi:cysteine-S-conjugate beta-lyase